MHREWFGQMHLGMASFEIYSTRPVPSSSSKMKQGATFQKVTKQHK